ncbi:type II secretion system protein N [Kangiella sp. TOML190]|uniref:type II secretion system protein N n=1 Tax=Kangiella sp. TOML190 TaxID=2931351 RepID=UPI00203ED5BB|nr:type II secretion system protein N [Kangiella sp. TOML190]
MKKIILGSLLGMVVLLVFIAVLAPAKTIVPMLTKQLPASIKPIHISGIEGSIWSPKFASLAVKGYQLERVSLALNPFSLLSGSLNTQLQVQDPSLQLTAQLNANQQSLLITDSDFSLDASRLDPLMRFPVKGLAGEIEGQIEVFQLAANQLIEQAQGKGVWRDAMLYYLEQSLQLGDIRFELSSDQDPQNPTLILTIVDNQGMLDLKGDFKLSSQGAYKLDLSMSEELPEQIKSGVQNFAKLVDGRYRIQWQGQLTRN